MSFLLDTNVVSEWVKPRPDPGVAAWLDVVDEDTAYISVITLSELRHGIARLPMGARKLQLDSWMRGELIPRFAGRILLIDGHVAMLWGDIVAERQAAGRPIGVMDGFIAATARAHNLTLVTRNEADFTQSVPEIINPWDNG